MYCRNKTIIILILLQANILCPAQTADSNQQQYKSQQIKPANFDKKEWAELKKKLKIKDYKPKKKDIPKKKKNPWAFYLSPRARLIIKWTMFGILIGALLFLVLRVLGINPFNKRSTENNINVALEELEENLDTAAIDPHLYAAIKSKNFKLAIRLYYLMIIQKLALKGKITWKKYKTNKHYLNELRNKEEYPVLQKLTLTYEKSWFGAGEVTERDYDHINSEFVNFLQNIK
ncbi:MAG: hypothetical protein JWN78_19 [Bacteroidota bacterium]|nr:hypothetical protein [Bacteroidota bacterium]